jgi:hypothetical protein
METTEKPKRTYQKHKTEKKITVKHYLNTRYFTEDINFSDNEDIPNWHEVTYPQSIIYVQVTYKRKNTKFRSKVPLCHLDQLPELRIFDNLDEAHEHYTTESDDIIKWITKDLNYILWVVNQEIKSNPNFDVSELPEIYHGDKYSLISFVEDYLKREIREVLYEKVLSENGYWEFEGLSKYKIYIQSSALNNLEYYLRLYPQLSFLKNRYSSHIWFLNIYLEQNGIGDITLFDYGMQQYVYHVPMINLQHVTTLYDYLTHTFQTDLKESLSNDYITNQHNEYIANQIITDIDKLILKYYK